MNTSVQKWGNSLALRLPSALAKDLGLKKGSMVELAVVDGALVVKAAGRKRYSLSTLLRGVTRSNLHSATDWGGATGREAL